MYGARHPSTAIAPGTDELPGVSLSHGGAVVLGFTQQPSVVTNEETAPWTRRSSHERSELRPGRSGEVTAQSHAEDEVEIHRTAPATWSLSVQRCVVDRRYSRSSWMVVDGPHQSVPVPLRVHDPRAEPAAC